MPVCLTSASPQVQGTSRTNCARPSRFRSPNYSRIISAVRRAWIPTTQVHRERLHASCRISLPTTRHPMFDCLVAGDANVDLLVDGVIALEPGTEKLASDLNLVLGGSSAITAFNLCRLGAKVAFAGVIGCDMFGRFVEEKLSGAGVDIRLLRRTDTQKTGDR